MSERDWVIQCQTSNPTGKSKITYFKTAPYSPDWIDRPEQSSRFYKNDAAAFAYAMTLASKEGEQYYAVELS